MLAILQRAQGYPNFQRTALLLAYDGSENNLVEIQGVCDYNFDGISHSDSGENASSESDSENEEDSEEDSKEESYEESEESEKDVENDDSDLEMKK